MEGLIIDKPKFDTKYFKIGEAIRVTEVDKDKTSDVLVQGMEDDRIRAYRIEWYSPEMGGCSGYESKFFPIYLTDIMENKIIIKRLKEVD